MNTAKIMQDPLYNSVVHQVESLIHSVDEAAKTGGITLKDSEIKSAIQKVLGFAKGKIPKIPNKTAKEKMIENLIHEIRTIRKNMEEFSNRDWITCLRVIDDSLKTRREMYGHSRGYLDFLKGFLEEGTTL